MRRPEAAPGTGDGVPRACPADTAGPAAFLCAARTVGEERGWGCPARSEPGGDGEQESAGAPACGVCPAAGRVADWSPEAVRAAR